MVDVAVRDAGFGRGREAGHAECARRGEILHLADHRRLDTLASAEQVRAGSSTPTRCARPRDLPAAVSSALVRDLLDAVDPD